jgi:hypothetical protein
LRNSAEIAQSVEQWTENPRVDGSIPSLGTNKNKGLAQIGLTFLISAAIFPLFPGLIFGKGFLLLHC